MVVFVLQIDLDLTCRVVSSVVDTYFETESWSLSWIFVVQWLEKGDIPSSDELVLGGDWGGLVARVHSNFFI